MRLTTANRKGGTGKTSTAGNLAFEFSHTHKTILLDCDSQGSLTSWLINDHSLSRELADVLYERCHISDAIVDLYPGLALIPTFSDGDLREYVERRAPSEPLAMDGLCADLEEAGYVFIVVDLPPGLGAFEQSVIAAMDRALLVLEPEFLAVDGLSALLDDFETILKKRRSTVRFDWLIANGVNASYRRHGAYLDALEDSLNNCSIFHVPQSAKVPESQSYHEPLALHAPNETRALPAYRTIAKAIKEERIG